MPSEGREFQQLLGALRKCHPRRQGRAGHASLSAYDDMHRAGTEEPARAVLFRSIRRRRCYGIRSVRRLFCCRRWRTDRPRAAPERWPANADRPCRRKYACNEVRNRRRKTRSLCRYLVDQCAEKPHNGVFADIFYYQRLPNDETICGRALFYRADAKTFRFSRNLVRRTATPADGKTPPCSLFKHPMTTRPNNKR